MRGQTILSNVVATQDELHAPFSGIVPEVASRAHVERVTEVIERALTRAGTETATAISAIAVTHRPGLIGSLLVGLSAGKALAVAWPSGHTPASLGRMKPDCAVSSAADIRRSTFLGVITLAKKVTMFDVFAPAICRNTARLPGR